MLYTPETINTSHVLDDRQCYICIFPCVYRNMNVFQEDGSEYKCNPGK